MALQTTHKQTLPSGEVDEKSFGVGDIIRVHQRITEEGKKERVQVFEGTVVRIKGRGVGKTVTVRKIGEQSIGIEFIFPLSAPTIQKIDVTRRGMEGVSHANLLYIREKSKKQIEKIYARANRRITSKKALSK